MSLLENILVESIFIFLHFTLFFLNYKLFKKIMHPAVLFSLVWVSIILLHFIFRFTLLSGLYPLRISTFLVFFMGVVSFSFGSFLITVWNQKKESIKSLIHIQSNKSLEHVSLVLRIILFAIILFGLPFYIKEAYQLFIVSNYENFFVGLRTELTNGDDNLGFLKQLESFSIIVFAFNLYAYLNKKNKINRTLLIGSLLISLTYGVFSTGRTFFVMILVCYLGLNYLANKKFSIKKYSWLLLLFLLIFSLIGIIYGKGGNKEDPILANIYPSSQNTAIYLVSSLSALDWELNHSFGVNYNGDNTLRFFEKLSKELNILPSLKINEPFEVFVFVPYPTNVYTFYSRYIIDFGKFYAWLIIGLFGLLHTMLHEKALQTKSLRYSLYYSFMLFPLLMSFFQDQYMSLFSFWLQIIFYTEIIILLNKFFIAKKW